MTEPTNPASPYEAQGTSLEAWIRAHLLSPQSGLGHDDALWLLSQLDTARAEIATLTERLEASQVACGDALKALVREKEELARLRSAAPSGDLRTAAIEWFNAGERLTKAKDKLPANRAYSEAQLRLRAAIKAALASTQPDAATDKLDEFTNAVWCLIFSMIERGHDGNEPWYGQDFMRVKQLLEAKGLNCTPEASQPDDGAEGNMGLWIGGDEQFAAPSSSPEAAPPRYKAVEDATRLADVQLSTLKEVAAKKVADAQAPPPSGDAMEEARAVVEAFPSWTFNRAHTEILARNVAAALTRRDRAAAEPVPSIHKEWWSGPEFDRIEGFVEATSFEYHSIWKEEKLERKTSWQEEMAGYSLCIGHLAKRPVVISVRFAFVKSRCICFWHATSQLSDYAIIEKWFKTYFANVPRVDAMNFVNVFRALPLPPDAETKEMG